MGASQVSKGKRVERELAAIIEAETGERCWRTPCSGAMREISGADLRGPAFDKGGALGGYSCEVKGAKVAKWWPWWKQARAAALEAGKVTMLAVRLDGEEWTCTVPLAVWLKEAKQRKALETEILSLKQTPIA